MMHESGRFIRFTLTLAAALSLFVLVERQARADGCTGTACDPQQGTWRFGTYDDAIEGLEIVLTSPYTIEKGRLKKGGAAFEATSFVDDKIGIELAVARVGAHKNIYTCDPSDDADEYQVTWRRTDASSQWKNLCPRGQSALAVPGTWKGGWNRPSLGSVAFACVPVVPSSTACVPRSGPHLYGGTIAKCIDLGYAPWSRVGGFAGVSSYRLHNACVALMTADYFGDGIPHTIEGTPILLLQATADRTTPLPQVRAHKARQLKAVDGGAIITTATAAGLGDLPVYHFEAAWTADSDGRPRALCMSKKRWATLPISLSESAATGANPRDFGTVELCDRISDATPFARGTDTQLLFFSWSMKMDTALYRFRSKDDPRRYVTTSSVEYVRNGTKVPLALTGCFKDLGSYEFERYEGSVLTTNVASFEGSLRKLETWKYTRNGKSYLVTATAEHSSGGPQSFTKTKCAPTYVFPKETTTQDEKGADPFHPLRLYRDATRFLTTSHDNALGTSGAGELLGYVLRLDRPPSLLLAINLVAGDVFQKPWTEILSRVNPPLTQPVIKNGALSRVPATMTMPVR